MISISQSYLKSASVGSVVSRALKVSTGMARETARKTSSVSCLPNKNRWLVRHFASKLLGSEFRASVGKGRSVDVKVVQNVDWLHDTVPSHNLPAGRRTWVV